MILGCLRPYFFSGLLNLLPQIIRLPLIYFSLRSVTYGEITSWEAPQGTGSDWKNLLGTAHTDRHCYFNI